MIILQTTSHHDIDPILEFALSNFIAMLENTGDYIYFKNRGHVFTGASQTLVEITEQTERWTDLVGKTDYDVFPREFADIYYTLEKQIFSGEVPMAHAVQPTLDQHGNQGWVDNRKYPIRDKDGHITGLFGIARDITALKQVEKIIHEKEERLSLAIRHSGIGIWDLNLQTQELVWDESMYSLYNITPDDFTMVSDSWQKSLHPDDLVIAKQELQAATSGKMPFNTEFRVIWPNGEIHIIKAIAKLFRDESGTPVRLLGINTDVTEQREAEVKLKLAASVFAHAGEGIMITDIEGNIVDVNNTFTLLTGYSHEEVIGQNPRALNSGRQPAAFYKEMWKSLLTEGQWVGEVWNRHKNGEVYAEILNISTVRNDAGQVQSYVAIFADITSIKKHQGQLEHIAHYDPLTDLPNRVLLSIRLNHSLEQCRRSNKLLAVAFLDIDNFKAINDTQGHDVGDKLLVAVSQRMSEA